MTDMESTDSLETVFVLQHWREDTQHGKVIGVYTSIAAARRDIARLQEQPGFRDYPDGFSLSPYRMNEVYWTGGFAASARDFSKITDVPFWALGAKRRAGETEEAFAVRLCRSHVGERACPTDIWSEFGHLKAWARSAEAGDAIR